MSASQVFRLPDTRETWFETLTEALEYGWVRPRRIFHRDRLRPDFDPTQFITHYLDGDERGGGLVVRDVSGPRSQGYRYRIYRTSQDWLAEKQPYLLQSTTIHLRKEKNKGGTAGSFMPMFHREDLLSLVDKEGPKNGKGKSPADAKSV